MPPLASMRAMPPGIMPPASTFTILLDLTANTGLEPQPNGAERQSTPPSWSMAVMQRRAHTAHEAEHAAHNDPGRPPSVSAYTMLTSPTVETAVMAAIRVQSHQAAGDGPVQVEEMPPPRLTVFLQKEGVRCRRTHCPLKSSSTEPSAFGRARCGCGNSR